MGAAGLSAELGYPATPEAIRQRIVARAGHSGYAVFVACLEGKVVGWIDLAVIHHLASDPRAEISGLVVTAELRSRQIGRLLVDRAEQWARAQGLTQMLVRSRSTREAAHRFYLTNGYELNKTSAVFVKDLTAAP